MDTPRRRCVADRALFKQVPPAREPLEVAAVVEEVLRIIAVECGDDSLAIETDVDAASVLADRVQKFSRCC